MRNHADRDQALLYTTPAFHVRMPERYVGQAGELARYLALVMREAAGITDRHGCRQLGDACAYLLRMLEGVLPAADRRLTKAPHGARFGIGEALQCEERVAIKR